MRKKHDFLSRLGERLDIPREALPAGFGVILSGRGELTVRGSRRILSYGEENIRLLLTGTVLSIKGKALLCTAFGSESMTVCGRICAIEFEEK